MAKDIQGLGLGLAVRFSGSEFAKKYKLIARNGSESEGA